MRNNQNSLDTLGIPLNPVKGPWGFWPTIGFGLLIFIMYLVSQLFIEIAFAVTKFISNPNISLSQIMDVLSNGNILTLSIFLSTLIGSGFTILFVKIRKSISIREYLTLRPIKFKTILVVLGIAILLAVASGLATSGVSQSTFTDQMVQAYKSSTVPALMWIAIVICAPVFEEIFFRGFLFVGFSASRVGSLGAIIITAAFWALSHSTQYGLVELIVIFGVGAVFGIVRWRTKSLYASLAMHSLWNLLAMVQIVLYIKGIIH